MTRLFTDGGEGGDLLRYASSYSVTATTAQKRTGKYSYSVGNNGYLAFIPFSPVSEFYARFAVRITSITDNESILFRWLLSTATGGYLRINAIGNGISQISMFDGTTLRASSSFFTMNASEWHVFEVHVKQAANPNGVFQFRFDGTLVLDYSGATNAQSTLDRFTIGITSGSCYYDDIAINNISGSVDNSWPGDGGVLAPLVPVGAGTYSDLIASAGNAYACIDEIPNSDTDYVYESTVDKKSSYAISSVAGLPAGASIQRVWVEVCAKESSIGDKIATFLRSALTDVQGSDLALTLATYRYLSAEYLLDPADSAAWTESKVNALEIGAVVR